MEEAREVQIESAAQALAMMPDADLLLLTIDSPEGERRRTEAPILRPCPASEVFGPDALDEYDGYAQLAFQWIETLEPLYAGHPGSLWPVQAALEMSDGSVALSGPLGVATIGMPEPNLAAKLVGRVDVMIEAAQRAGRVSTSLPTSRKERFYTGTVLPMIVSSGGIAELRRLLHLCGLPEISLHDPDPIQFFTEYSFAESVYSNADKARFAHRPRNADTPNIVLQGPGWLLAIEAKMFHRPNAASLNAQYRRQSVLVDYWAARFGVNPVAVRHVLLLPEALAAETAPGLQPPVITWESIVAAYQATAPTHWLEVLREALARYPELASKDSLWGQNAQQKLTGETIVAAWKASDPSVAWVGRSGGANGKLLAADIASGRWKPQTYEVSSTMPTGKAANWFPAADFVARVTASE